MSPAHGIVSSHVPSCPALRQRTTKWRARLSCLPSGRMKVIFARLCRKTSNRRWKANSDAMVMRIISLRCPTLSTTGSLAFCTVSTSCLLGIFSPAEVQKLFARSGKLTFVGAWAFVKVSRVNTANINRYIGISAYCATQCDLSTLDKFASSEVAGVW